MPHNHSHNYNHNHTLFYVPRCGPDSIIYDGNNYNLLLVYMKKIYKVIQKKALLYEDNILF